HRLARPVLVHRTDLELLEVPPELHVSAPRSKARPNLPTAPDAMSGGALPGARRPRSVSRHFSGKYPLRIEIPITVIKSIPHGRNLDGPRAPSGRGIGHPSGGCRAPPVCPAAHAAVPPGKWLRLRAIQRYTGQASASTGRKPSRTSAGCQMSRPDHPTALRISAAMASGPATGSWPG